MEIPIYQVDAFTCQPFRGNPAAVCLLAGPQPEGWMQAVAQEMNLSETAFIWPEGDSFRLRWFTPTVEVDLCGHATLASAHILWEAGWLGTGQVARFNTKSGLLTAKRSGEWIELDFPATPVAPAAEPEGLRAALGIAPLAVGRSCFDYVVEVEHEEMVRDLRPDMSRLRAIPTRLVIVTSRPTTPGYDFVSRSFGPCVGVDEDPVTGSAHCALGPYWAAQMDKDAFVAYQASKRGGEVRLRLKGARVAIGGQAVTVLKGSLQA